MSQGKSKKKLLYFLGYFLVFFLGILAGLRAVHIEFCSEITPFASALAPQTTLCKECHSKLKGRIICNYDNSGRLIEIKDSSFQGLQITYEYDSLGGLTAITDSNGTQIVYSYGPRESLLLRIKNYIVSWWPFKSKK